MSSQSCDCSPAVLNLCVVLDQSGSMQPIQASTQKTLQELIKSQKGSETKLTLLTFNEQVTCVVDKQSLAGATVLTLSRPTGGTALYDAVGNAINRFDEKEAVFMAVITDGLDNESSGFTAAQVADLVRARSNWSFVFYAANQDSKVVGAQMGFVNTQDFQFSSRGMREISQSASRSCDAYRLSQQFSQPPPSQPPPSQPPPSQPPPSYPPTPLYQTLTPPPAFQPPAYKGERGG